MMSRLLPFALLLIAIGTCIRTGRSLSPIEKASWKLVSAPPMSGLNSKSIDILTLGHRGIFDDIATIWIIQFLGDKELVKTSSAEDVYKAIYSFTRHQPRMEGIYLLSCFVLALDFDHPEYCESISLDGLKAFPDSWRIPMAQGFIASFKLQDDLKAAAFYQMAASRPNSPEYVGRLAKRLSERGYANGQDLNETIDMLSEVPGGTRIIEILRERMSNQVTPPRPGGIQ
jgi:hypothetical protein